MFVITHELIEQKETKLIVTGGSRSLIIPASWLEKLQADEDTLLVLRLCKSKKGTFIDAYKKE